MTQYRLRIEGQKVALRDLTERDVRKMYYWNYEADDQEHHKWNGPYYKLKNKTPDEFLEGFRMRLQESETDQARSIMVIEADQQLIGIVSRYWEDQVTNWVESGIVIFDSSYWSGGYGTEAFQLWTDYLFEHMNIVRLGISTWSGNVRMMNLARKIGMVEEGRIRKARIVEGEYYDSIKMGMLREEWERLRTYEMTN
ncbi:GNAT family N-acetyltransferase [Priestia koreensis]|uniref:GNAT family N-acetyltransferase n=1 Tax=Priestia koreensis TaxID=284581 RepID=UPI001F577A54|nr:GNAT family protein [Priestia koreensis]UNL82882.1 GNAT family N-acetyltransferase [Priestia koreensis]